MAVISVCLVLFLFWEPAPDLAREGTPASADAAVRSAPPRLRERRLRHVSAETALEAPEESILAAKRLLCTRLIAEYKTRNGLALMGHPP